MSKNPTVKKAWAAEEKKVRADLRYNAKVRKEYVVSCDTCTKSYCCNQIVTAALFEGVVIADKLMSTFEGLRKIKELKKVGDEQRALIKDLGWAQAATQWFDWDRDCLFLKDGRCTIYDYRPVACSSYCVITDPRLCAPPTGQTVAVVNQDKLLVGTMQADGKFIAELYGKKDTLMITDDPFTLGEAVHAGMKLICHGPEALGATVKGEIIDGKVTQGGFDQGRLQAPTGRKEGDDRLLLE